MASPKEKKRLNNPDYDKVIDIYKFQVRDKRGEPVTMSKYEGNVLIIVNISGTKERSFAGYNYKILNSLYQKYKETEGLRILAFPCKQHDLYERSKNIVQFARKSGVVFDIFRKINVNCDQTSPLWKFLKRAVDPEDPYNMRVIKTCFTKFIVNRLGIPVKRFGPYATETEIEYELRKVF